MPENDDLLEAMVATLRLSGVPEDTARQLAPGWLEAVIQNGVPDVDPFNHIMEFNPALIDALSFGLDVGPMCELREMAEAGLLVPSMVERALRRAAPDLIEMARSLPRHIMHLSPERVITGPDGYPRPRIVPLNPGRVVGGPTAGPADWYGYTPHSGDLPPANEDPDGVVRGMREAPDKDGLLRELERWAAEDPAVRPGLFDEMLTLRPEPGHWIEVTTITDAARVYEHVGTGRRMADPFTDYDAGDRDGPYAGHRYRGIDGPRRPVRED